MKALHKEDIRRLLDLYMEGGTSREEEARLAEYFRSGKADAEFAEFGPLFAMPESNVPFVSEKDLDTWAAEAGLNETTGEPAATVPMPTADKPDHNAWRIFRRLAVAASIAIIAFFIGRHARPEQEIRTRTITQTKLEWKTDTLVIEKEVPVLRIKEVTVPVPVEIVKETFGEHLATVPPAAHDTTDMTNLQKQPVPVIGQDHLAMTDDEDKIPEIDDIQAEFNRQRKRMYEFSSLYEPNHDDYE